MECKRPRISPRKPRQSAEANLETIPTSGISNNRHKREECALDRCVPPLLLFPIIHPSIHLFYVSAQLTVSRPASEGNDNEMYIKRDTSQIFASAPAKEKVLYLMEIF